MQFSTTVEVRGVRYRNGVRCVEQAIDWLRFVRLLFSEVGVDIADTEEIIVRYPDYVLELGRLLRKTSPRSV